MITNQQEPIPVILKGMRNTLDGHRCIKFWLEIFNDRQKYQISFLSDNIELLNWIKSLQANVSLHTTPQESRKFFESRVSEPHWQNIAAAHIASYQIAASSKSSYYWAIDADDIMILGSEKEISQKLVQVEHYVITNKMDGMSADVYYTLLKKHWSFGVAFLKNDLDNIVHLLLNTKIEDVQIRLRNRGLDPSTISIDQYFDYYRDQNTLKLGAYALDGMYFVHPHRGHPIMNQSIYKWSNRMLWEYPLDEDVLYF